MIYFGNLLGAFGAPEFLIASNQAGRFIQVLSGPRQSGKTTLAQPLEMTITISVIKNYPGLFQPTLLEFFDARVLRIGNE